MKLGLPSGFFPFARASSSSSLRKCRACFSRSGISYLWTVIADGPRCCSIVLSSFSWRNSAEYRSTFLDDFVELFKLSLRARLVIALITGRGSGYLESGAKLISFWFFPATMRYLMT